MRSAYRGPSPPEIGLGPLESPFAQLLEPVQDVCGYPVVDSLPDPVERLEQRSPLPPVKVEPHPEEDLSQLYLAFICNRGASVDGKDTDRITTPAGIEKIAGIVEVGVAGKALNPYGVQLEKWGDLESRLVTEWETAQSQWADADLLEPWIDPLRRGDVVRPARGVPVPAQQFLEDVPYRSLDADFVKVQHGVAGRVNTETLHDPVAVVLTLSLR